MGKAVVCLQPGWADWEAGYVLAVLRRNLQFQVIVASPDGKPVQSIGGLSVDPDISFGGAARESPDILLLIGSDAWTTFQSEPFFKQLREARERGTIVAAICAATLALARAGVLEGIAHTSNGVEFIQAYAPDYAGSEHYAPSDTAVADGRIVTASGLAALTFAREVFRLAAGPDSGRADAYFEAYSREARRGI